MRNKNSENNKNKSQGRMAMGMLLVLVVVLMAGIKMSYRGWTSLGQAKNKAQAEQPAALVWPPQAAPESEPFCHTVKLTLPQLDKANEEGFAVDQGRRCITREAMRAHDEYLAQRARSKAERDANESRRALEQKLQAELEQAVAQQVAQGGITLQNLGQAREGKTTQVANVLLPGAGGAAKPLPKPPAELFVPVTYHSGGMPLAGFVTPNPKDGKRHPVIIWLTGGDSNTLDDFWTEGTPGNDQSASAFRKADMVMMFPTLRGGNSNPGQREYFWGEVDDVTAAVLFAARLPYVDPARIYLGGHSTGATLALLVAGTGLPVQGVFAFGPVADPSTYTSSQLPVAWKKLGSEEQRLRAPIHWLHAIKAPTWIIEGANPPSNTDAQSKLCKARKSEQVHCVQVAGLDHFSVLQPLTRRIAAQLAMGEDPKLESTAPLP
ncbi:alpha/beta hydrolase family protein [Comamonas sp. 4034]|uniref:alpha/beta hydrolase family protein n=1 Tax=Comamonas sp. 4034 TaxID=3156455 RepID=UPI003D1DA918